MRAALSVLGEMAQAIKKPGFEKLAKFFYPTVLQILGDGAKQNRDDALRCSQAFAANASLSTTLSAAAAALTGEKDSAALRREVLTFLNEHMAAGTPQEFAAAGDGLQSLIRPVLVCVLDRQGDVRKLADAAVAVIAKYVAYASFEPHLEKYNPAQKDALAKVLAKYYKAPTTTTAPLTPSSELKAAKRTSSRLPSSRQSAPSTPTKSAAESTAKSPRKREPARTAQLGLLLVDPARKLERSKVAAFYDPKVLGAVAGRQSLRDYLKSGPLAEPAAAAQMFSLDPAVLAQALTEFTALVAKNPAAAASSSDLLIVWCVTAVMGDADDSVATKSCALLVKHTRNTTQQQHFFVVVVVVVIHLST